MISLLVPTRGRPESFGEMAETAYATAEGPIEIVARLDDDDPTLPDYPDAGPRIVGPRDTMSDLWNQAAVEATGEILMMCADDIRFRTDRWDRMVADVFELYPDRIVFVYGQDGNPHNDWLATHGFMHRRWYETTGMFTWPGFSCDYGDLWNTEIAQALGRLHYLPEMFTEHMHPSFGKAEWDLTHKERLDRHNRDNNEKLYQVDFLPDRLEMIEQLRRAMQELAPEARRRVLKAIAQSSKAMT